MFPVVQQARPNLSEASLSPPRVPRERLRGCVPVAVRSQGRHFVEDDMNVLARE